MASAARESRDPLRLPLLVGIAIVCGLAGFGVARASLDVDRAALAIEQGGRAQPEEAAEAPGPQEPPAEPPEPAAPLVAPTAVDAGAPPSVPPPPSAPPSSAPVHVEKGRVAYIRCEGLASGPPSGPCPRDLTAERRIWEAIEALPACPALAGRTGASDVRVVFDGLRVSGLGFRDVEGEVDRESVRACLEPALASVRSGTGASRMTAAFRFDLTP